MKYYDLKNKKYISVSEKNIGLKFLYTTMFGRIILKLVLSKGVRKTYFAFMNSKLSKYKINKFIKKYDIDVTCYQEKEYDSFNSFFKRKMMDDKLKIDDGLFAIADSKLSVYKIDENSCFEIKNSLYTVSELVGDDIDYKGGYAFIFRLSVDNYHRYLFIDDGEVLRKKRIPGLLNTVQPIAFKRHKVFLENSREVTVVKTDNYGELVYIEVGAMMVGKIVNHDIKKFRRGEEKGYFEFSGSTVVLLFKKDIIKPKNILIDNTYNGIENIVRIGERLDEK